MAFIDIVSPNNFDVYNSFFPPVLKKRFMEEEGYAFYGISEESEAEGAVILQEVGDTAKLRFLYILPHLRGTGTMDMMLSELFLNLRNDYINYVSMYYVPKEQEVIRHLSQRFGFRERQLDYGYFKFTGEELCKTKAASITPQGIVRLKYLPEDKKERLWKLVKKYMNIYDNKMFVQKEFAEYSVVYMENDDPKGVLLIQSPEMSGEYKVETSAALPEKDAYDISLFFVGMGQQKAPLYLISALCQLIKKELPENTVITGYFPEGHVTRLIEGMLGIKASHEVCATLDLNLL